MASNVVNMPDQYELIDGFPVTVGTVPVRLSAVPIGVPYVIIQASLGNLGVVCVGGPAVTVLSGLELDAGRAIGYSVDQKSDMMQFGMLPDPAIDQNYWSRFVAAFRPRAPRRLLNLASIWVVSTIAAQTIRVQFTQSV